MSTKKLKIVLFGPSGAGKTSIIRRLLLGKFYEGLPLSTGVELLMRSLPENNPTVQLEFWNIVGTIDPSNSMMKNYYKNADRVVIVFDAANTGLSFQRTIDEYLKKAKEFVHLANIHIFFNKVDTLEKNENIKQTKEYKYICKKGVRKSNIFCTSAKEGHNIEHAFGVITKVSNEKNEELIVNVTKEEPPTTADLFRDGSPLAQYGGRFFRHGNSVPQLEAIKRLVVHKYKKKKLKAIKLLFAHKYKKKSKPEFSSTKRKCLTSAIDHVISELPSTKLKCLISAIDHVVNEINKALPPYHKKFSHEKVLRLTFQGGFCIGSSETKELILEELKGTEYNSRNQISEYMRNRANL